MPFWSALATMCIVGTDWPVITMHRRTARLETTMTTDKPSDDEPLPCGDPDDEDGPVSTNDSGGNGPPPPPPVEK